MNEQQVADLFSEQIDRLLGGEPVADIAGVEDLLELLTLGQQLSEVSFQLAPAAQAAFLGQLAGWFGSANGGVTTTIFSIPKIWLLSLVALVAAIGAGLGWMGLNLLTKPGEPPATIEQPVLNSPAIIEEVIPSATPRVTETVPLATPAETRSRATTSLKDTLPTEAPSLGDTLPTFTPTPEPTTENATEDVAGGQPNDDSTGDSDQDGDGDADDRKKDDHDRGHGNDPAGYDEDNPGNSSGVPIGEDGNKGNSGNVDGQGQEPENNQGGGRSGGGGGNGQGGGKK